MSDELWRPPPKRAYKPRDAQLTSEMMAAVRNKNSKAEMLLRRALWSRGLRYRLHTAGLKGKPDIVFARARVVVFVDGDYWHGRAIVENGEDVFRATMRTERREWWIAKLNRNIARDREVTDSLVAEGWTVLRFWEGEVQSDVGAIADRIAATVATFPRRSRRQG